MNDAHLEILNSAAWRELLRDAIVPYAVDGADLGDDVLEIGPGPGATTELLIELAPRLTAVELDAALAADLRERLAATGVDVVHADGTATPFPAGRFSAVVCFTMLHHVPTAGLQDALFAEAARVLRPGGLFVASDSRADPGLEALHDGDVYNPVDPATVGDRLRRAGFATVAVRTNDFGWAAHARR